jgi:hypothetical protein
VQLDYEKEKRIKIEKEKDEKKLQFLESQIKRILFGTDGNSPLAHF